MMPRRIAGAFLTLLATIAVSSCSSPSLHFYNLASTASPNGQPDASYAIEIEPVAVPVSVDQPQFVLQTGPNQVYVDEYHRWVAPLGDSIAQVVAANLATLLGTPNVSLTSPMDLTSVYLVRINVQRFEAVLGESVLVEAVWMVRAPAGGAAKSGRTIAREPVTAQDYHALAAAYSEALATLSGDIAAAIRTEAATPPKP